MTSSSQEAGFMPAADLQLDMHQRPTAAAALPEEPDIKRMRLDDGAARETSGLGIGLPALDSDKSLGEAFGLPPPDSLTANRRSASPSPAPVDPLLPIEANFGRMSPPSLPEDGLGGRLQPPSDPHGGMMHIASMSSNQHMPSHSAAFPSPHAADTSGFTNPSVFPPQSHNSPHSSAAMQARSSYPAALSTLPPNPTTPPVASQLCGQSVPRTDALGGMVDGGQLFRPQQHGVPDGHSFPPHSEAPPVGRPSPFPPPPMCGSPEMPPYSSDFRSPPTQIACHPQTDHNMSVFANCNNPAPAMNTDAFFSGLPAEQVPPPLSFSSQAMSPPGSRGGGQIGGEAYGSWQPPPIASRAAPPPVAPVMTPAMPAAHESSLCGRAVDVPPPEYMMGDSGMCASIGGPASGMATMGGAALSVCPFSSAGMVGGGLPLSPAMLSPQGQIGARRANKRFNWSEPLHAIFLEGVAHAGGINDCTPQKILGYMQMATQEGRVPPDIVITRNHVASHLQKHRMRMAKLEEEQTAHEGGGGRASGGGGGDRHNGDRDEEEESVVDDDDDEAASPAGGGGDGRTYLCTSANLIKLEGVTMKVDPPDAPAARKPAVAVAISAIAEMAVGLEGDDKKGTADEEEAEAGGDTDKFVESQPAAAAAGGGGSGDSEGSDSSTSNRREAGVEPSTGDVAIGPVTLCGGEATAKARLLLDAAASLQRKAAQVVVDQQAAVTDEADEVAEGLQRIIENTLPQEEGAPAAAAAAAASEDAPGPPLATMPAAIARRASDEGSNPAGGDATDAEQLQNQSEMLVIKATIIKQQSDKVCELQANQEMLERVADMADAPKQDELRPAS
ncbi:unnamed protein product [Vitrella brassicaformis CCMP3155]|uniref:Myb-like domain-containing protein n=2 Tax=Vitrella brassicaformis TaxID=1169539 RepID=A0A0G4EW52_VITBC|nr:unnamed protein product [Vitrella brassicaformis CCMP3155]|eukprot:CEM02575.1 unnamed protein product [Vitrella brassicaformis CCMP3155]